MMQSDGGVSPEAGRDARHPGGPTCPQVSVAGACEDLELPLIYSICAAEALILTARFEECGLSTGSSSRSHRNLQLLFGYLPQVTEVAVAETVPEESDDPPLRI